MGLLIDGEWHANPEKTSSTGGRYVRAQSKFRNWITADGAPGPSGEGGFPAASGRYHLYVAWACPWAHRTLIFRTLKGLEPHIGLSIVDPVMGEEGWVFSDREDTIPDTANGASRLYEVYLRADPDYTGRVSVPVLWDTERQTVVNNESAEIIRMFNTAFDDITGNRTDYYPAHLRAEIDAINDTVYETVNNGVYRAGFATTQDAYEEAFMALFATLDKLEDRLSRQRYLVGGEITEADWRLFTTLLRFDPVYVGHFKCNRKRIADYPNLHGYLRELYQWPGIAETVNMAQTKLHYYASHRQVNPTGIVPLGPELDLASPHGREAIG
ncbi:glutathione S-transferase family protein [Kaustia mangrovi]|uniref:Glutathione S-transferase family protein n=1 Tax=Kaustia mangrovi TaxID=2593653 RepID=A0A7S8C6E6_9HYPH|nr:glutathione S-transferase family protein [Kaustia mangrovi]QPC44253.1 glutathione S-transferase family protein [Kaustia mangrovi]